MLQGAGISSQPALRKPNDSCFPPVGRGGSFFPAAHALRLKGGAEEEKAYDSKAAEKYDQALWDILRQHPDEIHFLNTVFNFLQRRTPCFSGPNAERNYEILIDTLTSQKERYLDYVRKGKKPRAPEPMPESKPPPPPPPSTAAKATVAARPSPTPAPAAPAHKHADGDACCGAVVPAAGKDLTTSSVKNGTAKQVAAAAAWQASPLLAQAASHSTGATCAKQHRNQHDAYGVSCSISCAVAYCVCVVRRSVLRVRRAVLRLRRAVLRLRRAVLRLRRIRGRRLGRARWRQL